VGSFVHAYGLSLVAAAGVLLLAMGRALRKGAVGPAVVVVAALSLAALHWRMAPELDFLAPAFASVPARPAGLGIGP